MGLDMYMYKVEKLTELEAIEAMECTFEDLAESYHFINKSSFDDDPDPMSDLIPYLTQLTVIDQLFDYNRCFADHGVNCRYNDSDDNDGMFALSGHKYTDKVVGSWCGPDGAGWSFASGAKIELSREQYESYCYTSPVEVYAWKAKEVGYWRKYYDFDDYIQRIRIETRSRECIEQGRVPNQDDLRMWQTENCGYYKLSTREKNLVKDFLFNHEAPYTAELEDGCLDDDSAIMYHAWW